MWSFAVHWDKCNKTIAQNYIFFDYRGRNSKRQQSYIKDNANSEILWITTMNNRNKHSDWSDRIDHY